MRFVLRLSCLCFALTFAACAARAEESADLPAADDVCSCPAEPRIMTDNEGICRWCGGPTPSGMMGGCDSCQRRLDRCTVCGKRLPKLVKAAWFTGIGAPADTMGGKGGMCAWRIALEGGGEKEVLSWRQLKDKPAPARWKRMVFRCYRDETLGGWVLWESYPLWPASEDRVVKGEAGDSVHWRIGGIHGTEEASSGGSYALNVPASPEWPAEVWQGKDLLRMCPAEGKLVFGTFRALEGSGPGPLKLTVRDDAGSDTTVSIDSMVAQGSRAPIKGRVLLRVIGKGDEHVAWDCLLLANADTDLEVSGKADGPVRWRLGGIFGPEVPLEAGSYKMSIPWRWAGAGEPYTRVYCGTREIRRFCMSGGKWEERTVK